MKNIYFTLISLALFLTNTSLFAQIENFKFETIKEIPHTSVKNQAKTGTCWSFGTTSFIESELMRMGKGTIDLSEMFTVRCTYEYHAEMFVRYHGFINFSSGAQAWDLLNVVRDYGLVPRSVYPGLRVNPKMHDHREMDKVLKAMVDVLKDEKQLSPVWKDGISGVLDAYLGEFPKEFEYQGKKFNPKSFRDFLGIQVNDYLTFTSFTHHPYNTEFVFESPDNWSNGILKNVSLDDLIKIIDHAILNGFSVAWASDVSDKGFNNKKGLAIVPEKDWNDMKEDEIAEAFVKPIKQKVITPEMRQLGYDNYETTDDHLMHIIGMVKDSEGTKYYKVKNSWGEDSNDFGGYFYASEAYVRLRTMSILVNKNAVPKEIINKF